MTNEKLLVENEFQKLLEAVSPTEVNRALLIKAWNFTKLAHGDTRRKSGDLYITHPLRAALILTTWNLDITTIVAELLHDTIEDGGATHADLVESFGQEVADLVEGVTKVSNLRLKGSTSDVFVETLRKMILVMARDLRVVFVKLGDRMHNMQTLEALPHEKQIKIAKETLEIYAPLAERLGMGSVKAELEDLAFKFLHPDDYGKLLRDSAKYYHKSQEHIESMKKTLSKHLNEEHIDHEIKGRKKHYYSLWKKLMKPEVNGNYENVFDIVALRIIVPRIVDCYATLGIVHSIYRPVPKIGISDFIAQPKPNGYASIHTKVFGPSGRIVEVQIRTHAMNEQAEHGAAAHWAYSEAKSHGVSDRVLTEGYKMPTSKLNWVKELVSWQDQMTNSEEFLKAVKFDGFGERNFIFSPKGDVFDLPSGSTPVDFAFTVHTTLGKFVQGAKVNGKIVPLNHKLQSGDVVEILKSKNEKKPNRDWLEFVVTTTARRQIHKNLDR